MISWFLPARIDPVISSNQFRLLEVHMGVDGKRLDPDEVSTRRYNISVDNMYIVVRIPIGSPDGFFMVRLEETTLKGGCSFFFFFLLKVVNFSRVLSRIISIWSVT